MVSLTARTKPKAVEMAYQQTYAESADWLFTQFKDWAITRLLQLKRIKCSKEVENKGYFINKPIKKAL
jgi:hypothetical protein